MKKTKVLILALIIFASMFIFYGCDSSSTATSETPKVFNFKITRVQVFYAVSDTDENNNIMYVDLDFENNADYAISFYDAVTTITAYQDGLKCPKITLGKTIWELEEYEDKILAKEKVSKKICFGVVSGSSTVTFEVVHSNGYREEIKATAEVTQVD